MTRKTARNKMVPVLHPARLAGLIVMLSMVQCAPKIGDDCTTNIDCGPARICDISQPSGYCTVLNCHAVPCPEESLCVEFTETDHYCMALCEGQDDCRDGYVCVKDFGAAPFCNKTDSL